MAHVGVRAVLFGGLGIGAAGAALLTPAMTADGSYLAVLPGLADGLQTGLYVIATGALLAIPAALALPNRRDVAATA